MAVVRRIKCKVERVDSYGYGVYSIMLRPEKNLPRFRPGQFCHFTLGEYSPGDFWPESRVFSIASRPEEEDSLRLCYSVVGVYTGRMEKELAVGKQVWIKLPYGEFVVGEHASTVLIAGGTGITPFLAYLQNLNNLSTDSVILAYGVRTPEVILDIDMLRDVAQNCPKFNLVLFSESGFSETTELFNVPNVITREGLIDCNLLFNFFTVLEGTVFYLSGPPAMLTAIRGQLLENNIPEDQINTDDWE